MLCLACMAGTSHRAVRGRARGAQRLSLPPLTFLGPAFPRSDRGGRQGCSQKHHHPSEAWDGRAHLGGEKTPRYPPAQSPLCPATPTLGSSNHWPRTGLGWPRLPCPEPPPRRKHSPTLSQGPRGFPVYQISPGEIKQRAAGRDGRAHTHTTQRNATHTHPRASQDGSLTSGWPGPAGSEWQGRPLCLPHAGRGSRGRGQSRSRGDKGGRPAEWPASRNAGMPGRRRRWRGLWLKQARG